jgi:1-acyl-sn-glycerol-3-phosphate acyltransferase
MLAHLRALVITDPLIILCTVVMGSLSLAASMFDASGRVQHRIARAWSRLLLGVSGVKVHIEGLEKLDPMRSYVLVANHLSFMDTPVVLGHIPLEFRFFAKEGLFHIPFLGWHLRRAGHISVSRDDPRASLKSLTEGARLVRERGVSALLFPEGGRSPAELQEFKEGAAYLAIKARVPAVPLAIGGTRGILPMGSIIVRPGVARVVIGQPIETSAMKTHDHGELTRRLRESVAELMDRPETCPAGIPLQ